MNLASAMEWLAWGGIVLPLVALAWAAVRYVLLQMTEHKHRRFKQFIEIVDLLDASGTIAGKCAAAYQLKSYPEHGEFIERFCRDVQAHVSGASGELLKAELRRTAEYFEGRRGTPK